MAKKRHFRLRISRQRTEALRDVCRDVRYEFVPDTEHTQLLVAYMNELEERLTEMLDREQENYTLLLSEPESIAFCQLWNQIDVTQHRYAALIVDTLLKKMHSSIAA